MAGTDSDGPPVVLVADDEAELAELYAHWLTDEYEVRVATGGEEALELATDDVDVALLDRRMPMMTGDEVLAALRERGINCRVAMITAVEPDVDIVDMPFDDYLVKPVTREELHSVVSVLLSRAAFDSRTQEFFALASKKATLESAQKDEPTTEYKRLTERMEQLRSELDETLTEYSNDDFEAAFRELPDEETFESPESTGSAE
ncbi:response regulator transcription factor [Salinigranum halophilum]|jgi:DNA-binding response OmpR family regulator|uniref:response regulator transcription factor n=1 Tax=Salinigranum halophilum TaxID=2565931 RepID=UPI0010A795AC|nr:response regulator [Salinigranum halophilum]